MGSLRIQYRGCIVKVIALGMVTVRNASLECIWGGMKSRAINKKIGEGQVKPIRRLAGDEGAAFAVPPARQERRGGGGGGGGGLDLEEERRKGGKRITKWITYFGRATRKEIVLETFAKRKRGSGKEMRCLSGTSLLPKATTEFGSESSLFLLRKKYPG